VWSNELFKLYWDQPVQVVGYSRSDCPDTVLWNKSNKYAYLIDVIISCDNNLHSKFCDKIAKYSDLAMLMKAWITLLLFLSLYLSVASFR